MSVNDLDILLIEDNPGDVRLIEEMLNDALDRSTATTESDTAGVRRLLHEGRLDEGLQHFGDGSLDVLLLDLGLPDSMGLATLEKVRDHSREVPIVVLTGLDDETIGAQAVQQGAQEYLVKDELTPPLLRRSLRHAIERKKFDRTQAALHSASRDVIQAESKTEVTQLTVETAVDVLDLSAIAIYLFDDSANVLQPTAYTDYVEDVFDDLPTFRPGDSAFTWQSFIDGETITLDGLFESKYIPQRDTPFRSGVWIPLGDHGVIAILSEEDGGLDQQTQQLADHLAATAEAALNRVEREESLREHERELAQQNRKLEDLNRMNRLIREIDQVLVEATTREAIEQAICERLTQNDQFAFAWVGEEIDGDQLRPRTWSGADNGYLDAVSLDTEAHEPPPAVSAMRSGTAMLTANIASDLRGTPWRKAALDRDLHSVISIPLTYNEISYGVLTVFATEPDAFDTRSTEIFEELGQTISNAMNAAETRQALLTDTVVELELAIHEPDDVLSRIARGANCQIEYGGTVLQSDGTTHIFFSASGTSISDILAIVEDVPSIHRLDHIGEADGNDDAGDHRFEMTASGPTIPSTLVECGGVARSLQVTDSETQVVAELPGTTDVRTFINRLEDTYPDTDLIARRDKERTDLSQQAFGTAILDALTDRQQEILQTAYHSGYFEWPRERTGEEVAESLGITQPTFNGHLRAAERKLCSLLFDRDTSSPG